uniref:Uncharacterized protein n=1 Tax=Clytia hemisphaerica TaxID=252671 RepID=A0A7M5V666_9CNID
LIFFVFIYRKNRKYNIKNEKSKFFKNFLLQKQVARRTIQSFFSNLVKKNVSNQRTLLVGFHGDTCGAIACRCTTFKGQEKEMCDQLQNQFGPMFHYCERFLRKVHLFRSEEDLQK